MCHWCSARCADGSFPSSLFYAAQPQANEVEQVVSEPNEGINRRGRGERRVKWAPLAAMPMLRELLRVCLRRGQSALSVEVLKMIGVGGFAFAQDGGELVVGLGANPQ